MLRAVPSDHVKAVISYQDVEGMTHTAMAVRLIGRWVYPPHLASDLAYQRAYAPIHVEWSGSDEG